MRLDIVEEQGFCLTYISEEFERSFLLKTQEKVENLYFLEVSPNKVDAAESDLEEEAV